MDVNIDDHMRSLKPSKPRAYEQRRRAENHRELHQKIAQAAFELHNSVGPARTTVSAIARLAGVQRLTVYRHFADDEAIFAACTTHSFAELPPPDPETWLKIEAPDDRLRTAISQLYDYYRRREQLLANLHRDAEMPVVAKALRRRKEFLARGVAILSSDLPAGVAASPRKCRAVIGHVLDFSTWRSLTDHGLTDQEAKSTALNLVWTVCRKPESRAPRRSHTSR